jgi:hypothetical protein
MYGAVGVNATLGHEPLRLNIIAHRKRVHCNNVLIIGPNQQQSVRIHFYGDGADDEYRCGRRQRF